MGAFGSGLSIGTLWLEISASVDDATKTLQQFGSDVGKQIDKQKKAWDGLRDVGDSFVGFGKSMTAAITVPLVGIAAAAVNTGRSFETSFNKIQAYGDITGKDLEKLQKQALALGKDTAFSAQQAADGMAVFASAGFKAEQIYAAMPGTLNLAAAGQMKVADAAEITKDILGQFNLEATESTHVADVLAKASADTSATLQDMATTLRYVGPQAHAMGISIEEVTAMIIELDKAGIRGEQAGTGLRGMLGALKAPSKEAAEALKELHTTISNADGTFKPFSAVLDQLKAGMEGLHNPTKAAADLQAIFGLQAGNAAEILIRSGGPALNAYTAGLKDSTGAADAMAKKLNQGLNYALDQLGGSLETAGIALSKTLLPLVKQALEFGTKLLNNFVLPAIEAFQKWPEPMQKAALALAAIAAASGPLLIVGGKLAGSFVDIVSAVKVTTGVLGPLAASFKTVQYAIANDLTGALVGGEAKLVGFVQVLTRFGPALSVAGIAVAGFAAAFLIVNERVKENEAALDRYLAKVKSEAIRKAFADGMKVDDIVKKFNVSMDEAKTAIGFTAETAAAASALVAQLGITINTTGKAAKAAAPTLEDLAAAQEKAEKHTKDLAEAVDKARKNLSQAEDAARRGAVGWDTASAAAKELDKAVKAQDADFVKNNKSIVVMTGSVAEFTRANVHAIPSVDGVAEAARTEADAMKLANGYLIQNLPLMNSAAGAARGLSLALAAVTTPAAQAARALKETGQVSDETLQKTAANAAANYETLKKYYGDSSAVAREAWRQMIDAQVNAGAALSADQQITLARMDQSQRDYIDNNLRAWGVLYQNLHDGMKDALHQVNIAVFTGDWAQAKDRIIDDLKGMGLAVLDKFTKPATDAIADFVANTLTGLLSGKGFGGVMDSLGGLGSAIGGIFKSGGGTALELGGIAGTAFPGIASGAAKAAGGVASGAGSAVSGIMGSVIGALNPIGMIGSALSGVADILGLFGVGKGGEMDRMNNIANDTRFLAWVFDTGGLRVAVLDIKHTLEAFVAPQIEAIRWGVESMNATLDSVTNGERSFSMNLYGTDPQTVAAYIGTQLRLQGGTA